MSTEQAARALAFRALHGGPGVFVIGSVWDAASAVVFEREGFAALGTSSAGIAYSHGLPDGEVITLDAMIDAVGRIAGAVGIPVSVDLESGYGESPEAVAQACRRAIEAGAVGINLEDARPGARELIEIDQQCARIRAIRRAADATGVPLFINARTDGFWLGLWDEDRRLADSIARSQAYVAAGADGVFVPGALERRTITAIAGSVAAPLNVLAMPGCPDIDTLATLGVRRLSQGSGPARASMALARRIARELLDEGRYTSFQTGTIGYAAANHLFAAIPRPREPSA